MKMPGDKIESDDDDSAPENISFNAAKNESAEQSQKINEQIKKIRESQKLKRKERQEKYIEQKKKKFGSFKLSKEMLEKLNDKSEQEQEVSKPVSIKTRTDKLPKNTKKTFKDDSDNDEDDVTKNSLSDFIPVKTFKNYGISVVSLKSIDKKPLIASEEAKQFKSKMFNRPGIRRQTAQEQISFGLKRKYVKSK